MKHSTQRILTTHVGSLPRPADLLATILAKEQGAPFDAELYARRVKSAVAEVVRRQAECGIDVVPMARWEGSDLSPTSMSVSPASSRARAPAAGAAGAGRASTSLFPNITNGHRRCLERPEGRLQPNGSAPARFPIAGAKRCNSTSTI